MADRICSVDGCERTDKMARGWCGKHYQRWCKYGDPLTGEKRVAPICSIEGCERKSSARGWCNLHYQRWCFTGDALHVLIVHPKVCAIADCDTAVAARGWCQKHYQRWKHNGDPLVSLYIKGDDVARFESKIEAGPVPDYAPDLDPCWLWTEGLTPNGGYGVFNVAYSTIQLAHQWSYLFHIGSIPDGLELDHLCRVTKCVNPYHLDPVTPAENKRRMWEARHGCDKRNLAPHGRTA